MIQVNTVEELNKILKEKYVVGINISDWFLDRVTLEKQVEEAELKWPNIKFIEFVECPEISEYLRISVIPTILYWINGNLKEKQEMMTPKEIFFDKLDKLFE